MKKVSLILPCFNEEECVEKFYNHAKEFLKTIENYTFEMIFINDGSKDKTAQIIEEIASKDKSVKFISFSRNFGQQPAILAGFKVAEGDACIELDVDMQDPIELLPEMLKKWEEGYKIVHATRRKRKGENIFKKLTSKLFYRFFNFMCEVDLELDSGEFKLYDKDVVDAILAMPERRKFLRGIAGWVGYKQCKVEFDRNERAGGQTKYKLSSLIKLSNNAIISNSYKPLFLTTLCGMILSVLSGIVFTVFTTLAMFKIFLPLAAWLFPTLAMLFGLAFTLKGIQNMYISRIYEEVKHRPEYLIEKTMNVKNTLMEDCCNSNNTTPNKYDESVAVVEDTNF